MTQRFKPRSKVNLLRGEQFILVGLMLAMAVSILVLNNDFSGQVEAQTYQTYWVATIAGGGSDSNPGTESSPWATFTHAFSQMNGGDTLIIKDGTYNQPLVGIPNGTAAKYTTIKAEHDFQVLIDGTGFQTYQYPLSVNNYNQIEGIKVNGGGMNGPFLAYYVNHVKVFRCAFYGAPSTGNSSVVNVLGSSYVLFEECWAWGTGRYKFLSYQSDHVIFRRCVSRHDYHSGSWAGQCATFTVYDTKNFLIENCIAINSGHNPSQYGNLYGGVWSENNANVQNSGKILGSLFLDIYSVGINDPKNYGSAREIKDTVIWSSRAGYWGGVSGGSPTLSIDHFTTGYSSGDGYDGNGSGVRINGSPSFGTARVSNCLIRNAPIGVYNYITTDTDLDYNDYFDNDTNFGAGYAQTPPSPGPNDIYVDPVTRYITRIESDSPLKGAASDGGDIGANIIYRYGVSGTLWGEPGYDQLTTEPLWPFPNEDEIKSDMASYNGLGPSGVRGFTAYVSPFGSPNTLTSYIWEYLGNQIPADIYGSASQLQTCSQLGGMCCSAGQQCSGGVFRASSNCGSLCCVGGSCYTPLVCNDQDNDGYGSPASSACLYSQLDCNNSNPNIHPGAAEICGNGIDEDCSGADLTCPPAGDCNQANILCVDDTAGATQEYSTIQTAANAANPGDTILVHDGTYVGFMMQRTGTLSQPITFKANGTNVIINSRNANTQDNINIESWTSTPADYIIVDGFKVQNSSRDGIRIVGGRGVVIKNNTVNSSTRFGILTGWTPGIQILNNTVTNTQGGASVSEGHGIYVSNSNVADDDPVVRGNLVSNNGGNGIQFNGDCDSGGDGIIKGALIENNIVSNSRYKGFSLISLHNSTIRNNVVFNNGNPSGAAGGIHLVDQPGCNTHSNNNLVVNNTVIESRMAGIRINDGDINNIIFNNIFISSNPIAFEGVGNYQSNNITQSLTSGLFINPSANDYHLSANSPAINTGIASYRSQLAPATDIENNTRPQGIAYDTGAYEYLESTSQTPNITLTKQANKTQASQGEEITYTITYTNQGQGAAQNIVITDNIPDGTTYVAGSATGGGVLNGNTLTWTIATLPAGQSGSVSFRVKVE